MSLVQRLFSKGMIFLALLAVPFLLGGCNSEQSSASDPAQNTPAGNSPHTEASVRRAFPQHLSYNAGSLKISNHTQAEQDQDVAAAYDRWKKNYLAEAGKDAQGHPRFRVKLN